MEQDLSKWIGNLPNQNGAEKLQEHLEDLRHFADSPEGKRMVQAIGKRGGASVQAAAEGLKHGDVDAVKNLVTFLQSSKEGKALVKEIKKITEQRER